MLFETSVIKGSEVVSSSPWPPHPDADPAEAMEPWAPFHELTWDLVMCVRFLEREYLSRLASMVRPGGFFLFVSFVDVGEVWEQGPRDPKRLLGLGELASKLGSVGRMGLRC